MEAFAAGCCIAAFIAYCHATKKDTREFHLLILWGVMFLSIIGTVIYHVGRLLLG